jgi:hypothetical protein
MKNFRLAVSSISLGAFLVSVTGFSAQGFVKMSPEAFRRHLVQQCAKTEACRSDEINQYVDGVTREIRMTQGHRQLLQAGGVEGTIDEIIRRVQDTGAEAVSVTIKAGEKVVKVSAEQLERLYELPPVQAMVRAGEKTVTVVVDGIEYSVELTLDLTKKAGIYQLTEMTVRTIGNVTGEVLEHAAQGTLDAIDFVVSSKPVVLVVDGVEYLAKKIRLQDAVEKTLDLTWQSMEVFAEGTWNVVKFTYKGSMFVLGMPVEFVKWIVRG